MNNPYMRVVEVAQELGVCDRHVRHLCSKGEFGVKSGKYWIITKDEVKVYKQQTPKMAGRPSR